MRGLPLLALLVACSGAETPTPPVEAAAPPAASPPAADAPPAGPRVPADSTHRFAARHILVAYQGAVGALPNVTRSREEARARIDEVVTRLHGGADFAELARAYSDDSTGPRGGALGGFESGTMVAPFESAVKALKVGEVSAPIETPFGFHVIERQPLTEIHAAHLLVTWAGAPGAPAGVSRSRVEAEARAQEAAQKATSGMSWTDLVAAYSDAPLKNDGGDLGWMAPGQMADALDHAAFDLAPGATSAVIETPVGFHLIRRLE